MRSWLRGQRVAAAAVLEVAVVHILHRAVSVCGTAAVAAFDTALAGVLDIVLVVAVAFGTALDTVLAGVRLGIVLVLGTVLAGALFGTVLAGALFGTGLVVHLGTGPVVHLGTGLAEVLLGTVLALGTAQAVPDTAQDTAVAPGTVVHKAAHLHSCS